MLLTTFLGFLAVLISWKVHERPREFFAWLLLLETSIIGVFVSLDLLLFFILWEIEVIPMYFLISIWGSGRKEYSAIKYVIYTLFGSAFMLAGILSLYFTTGSLNMVDIANQGLGMAQSIMPAAAIFFLLFIGFAVKLPVFPLHTWLPDAHTDAPTAVSVMLAGVLIKMGGYGMIRLCVSMFPGAGAAVRPAADYPGAHRHSLRRRRHPEADRHQAADRLQQHQPHGLCAAGHLRPGAGEHDRRRFADVQPRHRYRAALRHGRAGHP